MNRVKARDAWARVSTKRYGFRLDGNEARIEIVFPSFPLSLSRTFSLVVPSIFVLPACVISRGFSSTRDSPRIIIASFVPFDYLGTMESCATTS